MHPYGNPHYMLDPVLAKTAVKEICDALVAFDPKDQADFITTAMRILPGSMRISPIGGRR